MDTSRKGRQFVKAHEGLRLCPYKAHPAETFWTVGYGHYGADVSARRCITAKKAGSLLRKDLERFEDAVRKALSNANRPHQCEFDALVDGAFNLGEGWVSNPSLSTLAGRLRSPAAKTYEGRKQIYREEIPKWVYSGGVKLPGLVQRRADEVRLATTGRYN